MHSRQPTPARIGACIRLQPLLQLTCVAPNKHILQHVKRTYLSAAQNQHSAVCTASCLVDCCTESRTVTCRVSCCIGISRCCTGAWPYAKRPPLLLRTAAGGDAPAVLVCGQCNSCCKSAHDIWQQYVSTPAGCCALAYMTRMIMKFMWQVAASISDAT